MPKLHTYRNRDGWYVLTAIKSSIITFQLRPEGERKLKDAGVAPNDQFPRALLLDLCRNGDAFTASSGVGESITESLNQLELDFAQDPDPETLFPACDDCGSLIDLNLSLIREEGELSAKLQCAYNRDVTSHLLDACIPLRLVNLSVFGHLFEIKSVLKRHEGVTRLETLFHSEFESKWEELRKLRRSSQQGLFKAGGGGELNLTTR